MSIDRSDGNENKKEIKEVKKLNEEKIEPISLETIVREINEDKELKKYLESVQLFYENYNPTLLSSSSSSSKEKLQEIISTYEEKESIVNRKERFRLLIDASMEENLKGRPLYPLAFDQRDSLHEKGEKGYFAAMYKAFELMLRTLFQPLTPELLVALHDMAVEGVTTTNDGKMSMGFAEDPKNIEFGLSFFRKNGRSGNLSIAEAKRLFSDESEDFFTFEMLIKGTAGWYMSFEIFKLFSEKDREAILKSISEGDKERLFRRSGNLNKEESLNKLNEFIDKYYKTLAEASKIDSVEEKEKAIKKAIASFCHNTDLLHIFADANIRTLIFLVSNKFLLENGFSPAIYDDPNKFDGHTENELTDIITQGIKEAEKYGFTPLKKGNRATSEEHSSIDLLQNDNPLIKKP